MRQAAIEAAPAIPRSGLTDWVRTVDHKRIGVLYIGFGLVSFVLAGIQALVMRAQLAAPELRIVGAGEYTQMFTMHGTTMIFLAAVPLIVGVANYFVPLMIGARDVAFPRLNALSFWLTAFGGGLLYMSFFSGGAPAMGWYGYTPLSDRVYSTGPGVDFWILALGITGAGTIVGAVNLVVTILLLRAPGMTLRRMPVFVWTIFWSSILILGAYPVLSAALSMLLLDRTIGTHFFDPRTSDGTGALLWQHLFWAFGHPEVYVIALPAFGIVSEVIPVFSGKPLFGRAFVFWSTVAISFLSFSVWAHHMFTVGLSEAEAVFFSLSSMLIAVPTGVKIFNWLATMWQGALRFTTAMLFAIGLIATFVFGGLTGVSLAVAPIDWQAHDTYYVVGHMHYVLFGGTMFGLFAGLYYWYPKMTGRLLSERLGRWHFWLALVGMNVAFLPQHWLGIGGMARRVHTYPAETGWGAWNLVSSAGAYLLALSVAILLWNLWRSRRHGAVAGPDPWGAWTLEWATTSPPPEWNFDEIPAVRSDRPLRDREAS